MRHFQANVNWASQTFSALTRAQFHHDREASTTIPIRSYQATLASSSLSLPSPHRETSAQNSNSFTLYPWSSRLEPPRTSWPTLIAVLTNPQGLC